MKRLIFFLAVFQCITLSVWAQDNTTLEYYLATAKNNSPLLNDYNNQRYSLKIDSLKLLADYGIHVTGIGDASYSPLIHGWGYNGNPASGQNIAAIVRVSKELSGKKNLDTRLNNYALNIKQLTNQSKITELQLNRLITEQYINTYEIQEQYKISQEIIELLNEEDIILKKLTQQAAFKQTDYLSFKVTLQQNLLTSQQQYTDWINSYATLNYLVGVVDKALQKLEPPLLRDKNNITFEQSVYAENYKTDSLKLTNDAKLIEYEYRPKLSLYVDGGYSSALTATPYKNFGASVGISLSVPIYDGNKRKMSLQQNRLAQNTRLRYNEFEKNQYAQQSAQIEAQIHEYKQMIATAREQLKYAQTLIEANLKQLPTGDVKVVDFILSINNYISLKSGLVRFETTLYNLYNRLQNLTLQ